MAKTKTQKKINKVVREHKESRIESESNERKRKKRSK